MHCTNFEKKSSTRIDGTLVVEKLPIASQAAAYGGHATTPFDYECLTGTWRFADHRAEAIVTSRNRENSMDFGSESKKR